MKKPDTAAIVFFCGLGTLPAFLFQQDLIIKISEAGIFILLNIFFRKKVRIFPPLIAFLSIVFMNLLSPYGKVIADAGFLRVTDGALESGIMKAGTFLGLLYLSKISVTRETAVPGRAGKLITETFYLFEQLTDEWKNIEEKGILQRLDRLLLTIDSKKKEKLPETAEKSINKFSAVLFALVFLGSWIFIFL